MTTILTILILGAMDVETDFLISQLKNPVETDVGCWKFYESSEKTDFDNKKIIVCRLNIGMNNASGAATAGILKYNPDVIISEGTAGGHNPSLHRGNILIGEKLLNMSCMLSEKVQKGGGIHAEKWNLMDWNLFDEDGENIVVENSEAEERTDRFSLLPYLYSDEVLVEKAVKFGNRKDNIEKYGKIYKGTLASSDNWNRELDRINLFVEKFGTDAEEMESFAITQISKNFKKSVLSIRIISNSEQHEGEIYDRNTGRKCQEFVWDFIKSI